MVPWTLLYEVSEARTLMALWSLTAPSTALTTASVDKPTPGP